MRIAPQNVPLNTEDLFTVTLPDGTTLKITSGIKKLPCWAGYCYLFKVNISREATLEIKNIEVTPINKKITIGAVGETGMPGIYSLEDLKAFRDEMNKDGSDTQWLYDGAINLFVDIDLNNEEWTPITLFNGTFNGNGHTISNLKIPARGSEEYSGFFREGGQYSHIKGLTINNAELGEQAQYCGVIAGHSAGTISDCHVKGSISIASGREASGGIAGRFAGANPNTNVIAGCTVEMDNNSRLTETQRYGCIVGELAGSFVVGCVAHDIHISRNGCDLAGIVCKVNEETAVISCVAYNCEQELTPGEMEGGTIHAIADSFTPSSYYYAAFGNSGVENFSKLNSPQVIENLNNDIVNHFGDPPCYFTASLAPSTEGPVVHPGAQPRP